MQTKLSLMYQFFENLKEIIKKFKFSRNIKILFV